LVCTCLILTCMMQRLLVMSRESLILSSDCGCVHPSCVWASGDRQVPSRLALGKLIDCCERTDVTLQDHPLRPNLGGILVVDPWLGYCPKLTMFVPRVSHKIGSHVLRILHPYIADVDVDLNMPSPRKIPDGTPYASKACWINNVILPLRY
jgi:hypothetical protein